MNLTIILMVIVACLVLVFTVQNVTAVTVSIFFWDISLSLALLIFFILAIGFIIGWFLHSFIAYRKDKKEADEIQADFRSSKQ
jgi:lipopolysaccharide assembly protein A